MAVEKGKKNALKEVVSDRLKGAFRTFPAGIYLLKVNNRNSGTRCEICSKLIIKIPERRPIYC